MMGSGKGPGGRFQLLWICFQTETSRRTTTHPNRAMVTPRTAMVPWGLLPAGQATCARWSLYKARLRRRVPYQPIAPSLPLAQGPGLLAARHCFKGRVLPWWLLGGCTSSYPKGMKWSSFDTPVPGSAALSHRPAHRVGYVLPQLQLDKYVFLGD